ncbi:YhcN/YlaJ family sporulation lipoprotein [Sporosarcina sp. CAU 1771]
MKKILMFTTVVFVSLSLVGCGANKDKGVTNTDNTNPQKEVVEDNNETIVNEENTDSTNVNETRMDIANEAADKVAEMDEVDSATIIVTDQNAYAAVMLKSETTELTDALEEKIADKVRETDSDIQKVYVSVNPDFVERMKGYGEEISAGNPVEGFFEEFTESVKRVFPDAH